MRVLYLATDAFGAYGGIAQYNSDLLGALELIIPNSKIDLFQRIGEASKGKKDGSIRLIATNRNKFFYSLRVLWHSFLNPPDIVFNAHIYHSGLSRMIAKLTRAKLVSQLHGTEIWSPVSNQILQSLQASDLVLCVSHDTKNRYLQMVSSSGRDNAVIQHNTVSDEYTPGNRSAARKKFNIETQKVLLTVGRLDSRNNGYKGHERVLRALPELLEICPGLIYLIAGRGDDEARLKRIVADLGLTTVVRFLGVVPECDLPDLYRASDIFVLPSSGEGFGIVYIEAMACGTPAIGLSIGGAPDALMHGELGTCVAPKEFASSLAAAVMMPPADRLVLAKRTRSYFGKTAFKESLQKNLRPLLEKLQ